MKKKEYNKCAEFSKTDISIVNGKFKICPDRFKEDKFIKMGKKNCKKYGNLKIDHRCDLIKRGPNYFIYVSVPFATSPPVSHIDNVCGIDPGLRKFATVYSNTGTETWTYQKNKLKKLNMQIDALSKYKRIRKIAYAKREWKKENHVDELYWKAIHQLTKSYHLIFYGDIKSHDIVKDGKNKHVNRDFNDMKFFKFKQRLFYKCKKLGKIVFFVNETYTTKTCSNCGKVKDIKALEVYKCN